LFAVGVFDVEVDRDKIAVLVLEDVLCRDLPGAVVFFAVSPPGKATGELFVLDRLSLGVLLASFRSRLLVVPDFLCRAGTVEEEKVGGDAGVRREGRWCGG